MAKVHRSVRRLSVSTASRTRPAALLFRALQRAPAIEPAEHSPSRPPPPLKHRRGLPSFQFWFPIQFRPAMRLASSTPVDARPADAKRLGDGRWGRKPCAGCHLPPGVAQTVRLGEVRVGQHGAEPVAHVALAVPAAERTAGAKVIRVVGISDPCLRVCRVCGSGRWHGDGGKCVPGGGLCGPLPVRCGGGLFALRTRKVSPGDGGDDAAVTLAALRWRSR